MTRQSKGGLIALSVATVAVTAVFSLLTIHRGPAAAAANQQMDIQGEIDELSNEMEKKKNVIEELDAKISHFKEIINSKKVESASLEDEVSLLDSQMAKTAVGIEIATKEIEMLEAHLQRLDGRIGEMEKKLERERQLLASLARNLFSRQNDRSLLEIMLSHDSFSEFFDEVYTVAALQRKMDSALEKLTQTKKGVQEERFSREAKRDEVNKRKLALEAEKRKLDDAKNFKETLLIETRASELEYRYMLGELKREQNEADSEIAALERTLREKIDLSEKMKDEKLTVLAWPVQPARGLSAAFHDPEYPYRYIFEHPGIDIRAYQGTAVRASAAGLVGRAKNAGLGYSYVMLAHNGEVSTVYGHLSRITVKEETFVERGEIIGYSGGMPGTSGAGKLTTGPHLHFETRLRGIPVDPMQYLVSR